MQKEARWARDEDEDSQSGVNYSELLGRASVELITFGTK